MKQKIVNYSIVLLFIVTFFGLYQAYNQNRSPFKSFKAIDLSRTSKSAYFERKKAIFSNDSKMTEVVIFK